MTAQIKAGAPDRKTPGILSGAFIERLLDTVESQGGAGIIQAFSNTKQRRDRYLREEWMEPGRENGDTYFREIDFEHLLTVIHRHYHEHPSAAVSVYLEIVQVCLEFGELQKAQDLLKFIEKRVGLDQTDQRIAFLMMKGKWGLYTHRSEIAQACYEEALQHCTVAGNSRGQIKALNNLGILSFKLWKTDQGYEYFLRAREQIGKASEPIDRQTEVYVHMNLGILKGMQGDFQQACESFTSLEDAYPDLTGLPLVKLRYNKGTALKDAGELEDAAEVLTDVITRAETLPAYHTFGEAQVAFADVCVQTGELDRGKNALSEAFKVFAKIHDRPGLAESYRVLGLYHQIQAYDDLAEEQFHISRKIATEYYNLLTLTETSHAMSRLMAKRGDHDRQRQYLQESLEYAEEMQAIRRQERLQVELDALEVRWQ